MSDKERIAELEGELEQVRSSQSGSDRAVVALKKENTELREQLESTGKKKGAEDDEKAHATAEREKLLDRREHVFELSLEKGIDPKVALTVLGLDETTSDDENRLDAIGEIKQATKDGLLRDNGRLPHETVKLKFDVMPPEQYNRLSDYELQQIPPEEHGKIIDEAISVEKKKRSGGTLRARLSRAFGGGE